METIKQWCHYREGASHNDLIQCNHKKLEYFQTSKVLSRWQARWVEIVSLYNFVIEHMEGRKKSADWRWRRPEYEIGYDIMTTNLLATWAASTITESYGDLLPDIKAAEVTEFSATAIRATLVHISTAEESQWRSIDRAGTYERRIYVPAALCSRVTSVLHDNPKSSHFGALKTAELVSWDVCWPAMESEIRKYVAGCKLCQQITAPRYTCHERNMPMSPSSCPSEGYTMLFVTDLRESTASGYTGILLTVDHLTTMATYLPCRKNIDSPELTWMLVEYVIWKYRVRENITTDSGKEFTSRFWDSVCSHLSINHHLSTAFHPQTDG